MREPTTIHCENGCGHSFTVASLSYVEADVKQLKMDIECPECDEVVEYSEDVTFITEFQCTGCSQKQTAEAPPVKGPAKTLHYCDNCGKETEWKQPEWEEIEVT